MMHELFMSPFFGIGLSIAAFWVGTWIRKKTGLVLCNCDRIRRFTDL